MSTYTFNENIPAATHNPSQDQPLMLQNNQSTKSLIDEDHYTFGTTTPTTNIDGFHKQTTFPIQNVPGGTTTDPNSVLYTDAGTASSVSDLRFVNANNFFPISCIRACGVCALSNIANPALTVSNSFNVVSVSTTGPVVTVTLNAGTVTLNGSKNNVIFLANRADGGAIGSNSNPIAFSGNTITFGTPSISGTSRLFFAVIQI